MNNSLRHSDYYVTGLLHGLSLGLGSAVLSCWAITMAWLLYAVAVHAMAV